MPRALEYCCKCGWSSQQYEYSVDLAYEVARHLMSGDHDIRTEHNKCASA